MYENSLTISTHRGYTLKELYHLFETEGDFPEPYKLVTEKCLTKHIRFPGLKKTAIEVYPAFGGQGIVVNLTKESRGKDFALSILTDGWNDVLSGAQMENAALIAKISEEVKRLVALSADAPPALDAGVMRETEVYSGFSTLALTAYDDRIELVNTKKGKTKAMPYAQIEKAVAKKDTLTVTMRDNAVEPLVFKSIEECAAWDELMQNKLQNSRQI